MTKETDQLKKDILFLRSLANEDRQRILSLLFKEPLPAQQVENIFFMEQSTASYHLNMMRKVGLLECSKVGKQAVYSYKQGSLEALFEAFLKNLNTLE